MPFGGCVYGAKRKASDNDEIPAVKKQKTVETANSKMADTARGANSKMADTARGANSKMADTARGVQDAENTADWERAKEKEMLKKKLTVTLPNAPSKLPRMRRQVHKFEDMSNAADQPDDAKPVFKRKQRAAEEKTKAETAKDAKVKESRKEQKVKKGGKIAEITEEDERKEERMKDDRAKDGGMKEADKAEDPRKVEKGKKKGTREKITHKIKTALEGGEKPLKRRGKAVTAVVGTQTEEIPVSFPVGLPGAKAVTEPDIAALESQCQAAPCQASQGTISGAPETLGQLVDREQVTTVDNDVDDNGCLSLHMLSHSMQRGSKDDQLYCLQYANDIMAYLASLEAKYAIPGDFSPPVHPQTNVCMRAVLVDWLIQVQEHHGLLEDSLHLCVAMLDVYLSQRRVTFSQFQLVGITCLFIASKYEERFPPTVKSLIRLTEDSYLYDEVIDMERRILKGLNHQLSIPTPLAFLCWFLWRLDCAVSDRELMEMMSTYILCLVLVKSTFSKFCASLKASAAIFLSHELLASHVASDKTVSEEGPAKASGQFPTKSGVSDLCFWEDNGIRVTGYRLEDLRPCAVLMVKELEEASTAKLQGAQQKFSQPQYHSISSHPALSSATLTRLGALLSL